MTDPQKIGFPHEKDDDGYPPAANEWLWAAARCDCNWAVDNVPWYSHDVSLGDVVTAELDEEGFLWFSEAVERSGHSTIRVRVLLGEQETQDVRQHLTALRCESEQWSRERPLLAVDVPAEVDIGPVVAYLDGRERLGVLGWESGHLADDHRASWPK